MPKANCQCSLESKNTLSLLFTVVLQLLEPSNANINFELTPSFTLLPSPVYIFSKSGLRHPWPYIKFFSIFTRVQPAPTLFFVAFRKGPGSAPQPAYSELKLCFSCHSGNQPALSVYMQVNNDFFLFLF